MGKLPPLNSRDVIRALLKAGFVEHHRVAGIKFSKKITFG